MVKKKRRLIKKVEWGRINWVDNYHVYLLLLGCIFIISVMLSSFVHILLSTVIYDNTMAKKFLIVGLSLIATWFLISISFFIIDWQVYYEEV